MGCLSYFPRSQNLVFSMRWSSGYLRDLPESRLESKSTAFSWRGRICQTFQRSWSPDQPSVLRLWAPDGLMLLVGGGRGRWRLHYLHYLPLSHILLVTVFPLAVEICLKTTANHHKILIHIFLSENWVTHRVLIVHVDWVEWNVLEHCNYLLSSWKNQVQFFQRRILGSTQVWVQQGAAASIALMHVSFAVCGACWAAQLFLWIYSVMTQGWKI